MNSKLLYSISKNIGQNKKLNNVKILALNWLIFLCNTYFISFTYKRTNHSNKADSQLTMTCHPTFKIGVPPSP